MTCVRLSVTLQWMALVNKKEGEKQRVKEGEVGKWEEGKESDRGGKKARKGKSEGKGEEKSKIKIK